MSDTLYLKPAPGCRVLDPDTLKTLPEEGAVVGKSPYWQRRLLDGSVVKVPPAVSKKGATQPAPKE